MDHLPVFLNLKGKTALVVGATPAAWRRAAWLARADAAVTLVTNRSVAVETGSETPVTLVERNFAETDLDGARIVCVATGDRDKDARIAALADARGLLVNVVDRGDLGSFIVPATIDRGSVTVAIGTGGALPGLASELRHLIEDAMPDHVDRIAQFATEFRQAAEAFLPEPEMRRRLWETVLTGPIAAALRAGQLPEARRKMFELLARPERLKSGGEVLLVGAGPGDPELLTLRALWALRRADIILYDELVTPAILDRARRDAERIPVGRRQSDTRGWTQDETNALMLRLAKAGRRVVRLKAGDPFIFGRGGEEVEYLLRHGITATVVPGLTAALGCAAGAGIPLTHRDHASAVLFAAGHGATAADTASWTAHLQTGGTLAVYMGLTSVATIADALAAGGIARNLPVAIIENGSRPDERISTGVLGDLAWLADLHQGGGPTLLVLGDVVRLSPHWHADQPLWTAAW